MINNIYNEDCISGMKKIQDGSIDLIITDPPFGIDFKATKANYNRKDELVLQGYQEVLKSDYAKFTIDWMTEATRTLKTSGSFFIFSGWNNLKDILNSADALNLTTVNHIVWKFQFGVVCSKKFVSSHYHCLFLCKNDKKRKFFNSSRYSKDDKTESGGSARYKDLEDVWTINKEYWTGEIKTPTKLPAEIIKKILAYTSEKNDIVLDPFLGSGQVAVVAKSLNRQYIGFEMSEKYFEFAKNRLEKQCC